MPPRVRLLQLEGGAPLEIIWRIRSDMSSSSATTVRPW